VFLIALHDLWLGRARQSKEIFVPWRHPPIRTSAGDEVKEPLIGNAIDADGIIDMDNQDFSNDIVRGPRCISMRHDLM
jgi:hypothetical protein